MKNGIRQQIIISGLGGQGVLFITRLLAEAAILRGLPVLTSETHGMAQRGGTVVSHLKVGDFSSPLIRPKTANGLLTFHEETLRQHGAYVKSDGWLVINSSADIDVADHGRAFSCDATKIALGMGNPRSANLVLLGFALSRANRGADGGIDLIFSRSDILSVLEKRLAGNEKMLSDSKSAIESGYSAR